MSQPRRSPGDNRDPAIQIKKAHRRPPSSFATLQDALGCGHFAIPSGEKNLSCKAIYSRGDMHRPWDPAQCDRVAVSFLEVMDAIRIPEQNRRWDCLSLGE